MKKVDCSLLPPCKEVLKKKISRCQYVSRMWWNSDQSNPTENMNPKDHGWKHCDSQMIPIWFDGPSFPEITVQNKQHSGAEDDRRGTIDNDDEERSEDEDLWSDDSEAYE